MSETYVGQEDFKRLEARVSAAEQEADGEKMLSRYILSQSRQNGDDLSVLKTRVERIEEKVDRLEQKMSYVETGLNSLRRDLSSIVAEAMRDVLRERKGL